ncbi:hypothetical protein OB2597_17642 [Pseudooceanicola batsensis HTCC2597]|uniref:Uncharacterized protein n=1 Tax=Pseudooceanicola batsensis (strain ATCC BAA-863 / DSM 15984 / KCTC 12145 / HTCC2597) TaxID=252305 RepID=A3TZT2_PSEBH|nr:hypothetical protein OB2597_17642 [Pseudooceanicola batsensis HTCC2597]
MTSKAHFEACAHGNVSFSIQSSITTEESAANLTACAQRHGAKEVVVAPFSIQSECICWVAILDGAFDTYGAAIAADAIQTSQRLMTGDARVEPKIGGVVRDCIELEISDF